MTIASIFPIIIVHVGACYAFDGLSHSFIAFAYQEVEVVAHEAVGVIAAVTATGVALVIVPKAHAVEGVDERGDEGQVPVTKVPVTRVDYYNRCINPLPNPVKR